MGRIIFKDQIYTFEQIQEGTWIQVDEYIAQTLSFCQDWLNGKNDFVLKTSGSTGIPKTIDIKRSQMALSAAATKKFFNFGENLNLLVCINTQMIGGKMMLVRGLTWDADIYLTLPESNPLVNLPSDLRFDFCAMVPLQVEECLLDKRSAQILSNIQTLIIGGAPSSELLIQKIVDYKLNAYQTYGMTETVSHVALAKIEGNELIYQTLPNVKIGIDQGKRLWVEAPMAKETRLQTNDVVEILDKDNFRWIGRSDFTINSGGIKIQAEQLEAEIQKYIQPIFGDILYFVYGQNDEKFGQKLVLILELSIKNENKAQELLGVLKENMKKFHNPKKIYLVEKFVKTDSGKINRTKTAELCF